VIPWVVLLALLGVVAVPLLGVGLFLLTSCLRQGWRSTERAWATVIGHEARQDDENTYYTPVARFLAGGQEFLVRGALAPAGRPPYRLGQEVLVYYPPGRPDQAKLARFEGWWVALVPAGVGAVFLLGVAAEVARLFR
jgi:hypothetical protein